MEWCRAARTQVPRWGMQDYQKLRVWQLGHALALDVARGLPARASRRVPGLRTQAVRAATSISWNIAEGCGKRTPDEFYRFLETALSSVLELESQLLFARELNVVTEQHYARLNERSAVLRKMLIALMQRVLATITDDATKADREP